MMYYFIAALSFLAVYNFGWLGLFINALVITSVYLINKGRNPT